MHAVTKGIRSFLALAAAVVAAGALASGATAEDTLLGEPWERPILDGLREQALGVKTRSAQAVLQEAKSRALRRGDTATTVARLYLLAHAYGLAGDAASARQTYGEVLRAAPRCYYAYRDLAMLDLTRNPPDVAGAERNLRRAAEINPGYLNSSRQLVTLMLQAGRESESVAILRRIVDREPSDLMARVQLARVLARLKRFPEAQREVEMLRRSDAKNPDYRLLEAEVHSEQGNFKAARAAYRSLADEFPASLAPLQGFLRTLDAESKAAPASNDPDETLWALERLKRIERDPVRSKQLQETLDAIRAQIARKNQAQAQPSKAEGPPSDADLLKVLSGTQEAGRIAVLKYVFAREEPPAQPVLIAVLQRLDATREPSPEARTWVLRILARFGGYGMTGLARHSVGDPVPAVRLAAIDALTTLSEQDASARAAAILVLGPMVATSDPSVSAAARLSVTALARVDIPENPGDAESTRQRAFLAWWAGPQGRETKLQAIEAFPRLKDKHPEGVLLPYLREPDFLVVAAAYRSLEAASASAATGPYETWWKAFPRFPPEQVVEANRSTLVARVEAWGAAKPR